MLVMKKIFVLMLLCPLVSSTWAQKIAFVDSEYILKNIPAFETANEQINQLAKKYEVEIKARLDEVATLYETYKSESVFLAADMKVKKENEIVEKEKSC
jgi:Outer membrane protein (OmpH-like).